MAFVIRALEALKPGGALGTLFPASLLSLQAAAPWREKLTDFGEIRLLASLGDFGLFTHALVQVACAVIRKATPSANGEATALITSNDTRATGEALRWLRKLGGRPPATAVSEPDWSLFSVSTAGLKRRATWRFPAPSSERALHALEDSQLPRIEELFQVRQGIQTGLNEALLLKGEEWLRLPVKERPYFRMATMSDSVQNGRVAYPYYLFFPHRASGPLFPDEASLRMAVPTYFNRFLQPNRERLTGRATIRRARRSDWWGLMRPREWSFSSEPRIISKFFGAEGGFAGDYNAEYVPVMGHVWLPGDPLKLGEDDGFDLHEVLAAYVAILNSSPFVKLLEIFSPHVAGGQFDLSSRHVASIPIPNLRELSLDLDRGRLVSELAKSGRSIDLSDPFWRSRNNQLATDLYGAHIIADL
jgi:adenine-specific DNA-methyltransferase